MAREPDNLVLELLREIRETQTDHSRLLNEHSEEFRRLNALFARPTTVMPGLEPGIQGPQDSAPVALDCRVKPGNDGHFDSPES